LLRVERIRLDQHALKVELSQQLLEHGALMVFSCGVASLSDERGTTAAGGFDRAT
jgi:hypothetical protein